MECPTWRNLIKLSLYFIFFLILNAIGGKTITGNTWEKLYSYLEDVEEQLHEDTIKIIPLKKNEKYPGIKDYYNKKFPLQKLKRHNGNLGICIGYNHQKNGRSIAVIDIDGYTDTSVSSSDQEKIKKETAEDVYNILKMIPGCMIVQSQSGGKHLYFWNRTEVGNIHKISEALHFPEDYHIEHLRFQSYYSLILNIRKAKN